MTIYKKKNILILTNGKTEERFFNLLKNYFIKTDVRTLVKCVFKDTKDLISFLENKLNKKKIKYHEIHIIYDREGINNKDVKPFEEDLQIISKTLSVAVKKNKGLEVIILLIHSNPSFEIFFQRFLVKDSSKEYVNSDQIEKELSRISKKKYDKKEKLNEDWQKKIVFEKKNFTDHLKNCIKTMEKSSKKSDNKDDKLNSGTLVFKTVKQILINANKYK